VVGVAVVLVLERVFVVGGEAVAATTRVLAGRSRDLDQISVAINHSVFLSFLFGLVWRRALYRYSGIEPFCAINSNTQVQAKTNPVFSLPLDLSPDWS
jgi:hypothetical protein